MQWSVCGKQEHVTKVNIERKIQNVGNIVKERGRYENEQEGSIVRKAFRQESDVHKFDDTGYNVRF